MLLLLSPMAQPIVIDPPVGGTSGYGGWGFASFTASLMLAVKILRGLHG